MTELDEERAPYATCGRCGVLLGDVAVHGEWHLSQDERIRAASERRAWEPWAGGKQG